MGSYVVYTTMGNCVVYNITMGSCVVLLIALVW